jgi:hypothetical protein|tara:strand:+ start:981 stop:1682 length:702 start_codon:yes stop_codon:yes gene_type:complete
MTSSVKKGKKLYSEKGLSGLFQAAIFKFLANSFGIPSRKIAVFNGIAVRGASLSSKIDIFPEHEAELISAIRDYVKQGERVLVIGGGSGASTVAVAHQVGTTGSVVSYEANKNSFARTRETVNLNKVDNRVEVYHTIIEKPVHLLGEIGNPTTLAAKELPDCDALVMDCEGAELPILENIKVKPRLIIVEAHPSLNSPKEEVKKLLDGLGYDIISIVARGTSLDVLSAIRKTG